MAERGLDYLTGKNRERFNLFGSLLLSVATSPIVAGAAAISALDTLDNPIYQQERVGRYNTRFQMLKIRTLRRALVDRDPTTYGTYDHRASWIGGLLRKTAFDELPQLFNVLAGEMSLVSLRGVTDNEMQRLRDIDAGLQTDWEEIYKIAGPGIAGVGQTFRKQQGDNNSPTSWREGMRLDIAWAETATLAGDIKILAQTPVQLLVGKPVELTK